LPELVCGFGSLSEFCLGCKRRTKMANLLDVVYQNA